jgi:hypothetical protein
MSGAWGRGFKNFSPLTVKNIIAQINLRQHLNTGQLSKTLPNNTAPW